MVGFDWGSREANRTAGDSLAIVEGNDTDLMQDKGVGGRDRESLAEETVSQLEVTGQSVLQADIENWQMTPVHKNNGHSTQAKVEGVEQRLSN